MTNLTLLMSMMYVWYFFAYSMEAARLLKVDDSTNFYLKLYFFVIIF
jgi:hypothetical protein